MKKGVLSALGVVAVATMSYATPIGILWTNVTEPVTVTNLATFSKSTTVKTNAILWVIGSGDANLADAAKSAGITKIHHIDKTTTVYPLGVYIEEAFTIYGE